MHFISNAKNSETGKRDRDGRRFTRLGVQFVRGIFRFDVALHENDAQTLDRWLAAVRRPGPDGRRARPFVVLNIGPRPTPPPVEEFRDAFRRFLVRFPSVRFIGPWNEPNRKPGRQLGTEQFRNIFVPPRQAADYFNAARAACFDLRKGNASCRLVAGEFAGRPTKRGENAKYGVPYYRSYLKWAKGEHRVGFHTASDMRTFELCRASQAKRSQARFDSRKCGRTMGANATATRVLVNRIRKASGRGVTPLGH